MGTTAGRLLAQSVLVPVCASVLSLCVPDARVSAQHQTIAPPPLPPAAPVNRYPLPTFDEDWSRLRESSQRDDVWDPVKFIPLDRSAPAFLSLGGEARLTYERFHHPDFGLSPEDASGYLLQRYLVHLDIRAGSRLRIWTEANASLESGREGGPRPIIDRDRFDAHQFFVDLGLAKAEAHRLRLRLGRQELAFGAGRLYALREGINVPLSFDGIRATATLHRWTIDAWAAKPVAPHEGAFDNHTRRGDDVWGIYASRPLTRTAAHIVEGYYLGVTRGAARFDQGTAREVRHTLGTRVARRGTYAYDGELMIQFGSFGPGRIRAWRAVVEGSRLLNDGRWSPRLGFVADVASGDRNRADANLETFNALFQSGTYSGRAQLLGPNNSIRLEPTLTFAPRRDVFVSTGWGFYWRQSEQDGLYSIPGVLVVPSNGVSGHYEGSRPLVQVDWQATRHFSVHVNCIYVFNAPFEQTSVHGTKTMAFISPWVSYRF